MTPRPFALLIALVAGILLVMGQSLVLIPAPAGEFLAAYAPASAVILGFLLYLVGLITLMQVAIPARGWMRIPAYGLPSLCLVGMAASSALDAKWVETALFVGLAILFPIQLYAAHRNSVHTPDLFPLFASLLDLVVGLGLLAWRPFLATASYQPLEPIRIWLGMAFVLAAMVGAGSLSGEKTKWKRSLEKLAALPWLAWGLPLMVTGDLTSAILFFLFAGGMLMANSIPWARLKLPENDIIGRRSILITAVLQTIFFSIIGVFLYNAGKNYDFPVWTLASFHLGTRKLVFLLLFGTGFLLLYGMTSLVVVINGLTYAAEGEGGALPASDDEFINWTRRIERLLSPFNTFPNTRQRAELQARQIQSLTKQLAAEKRRTTQLTLLNELSQQLDSQLDAPVASQLAVNSLQRSLNCTLVVLYIHEPERHELVALAAAGNQANLLPPGYRQSVKVGVLGRTVRLRKTQVVGDARTEADFLRLHDENTLSTVVVPLIDHGHLKALLEISDDQVNAFSSSDVQITEAVAAELLRAWERSDYHQRLTELIRAGISLTAQPDPQMAVQEVATIARQTLRARFTFVTLLDQEGNFSRIASAGYAPRLQKSLNRHPGNEPLMRAALHSAHCFRVRDLRKYQRASHIELDHPALRSMIAIPIRMHRLSVGAILAFGKQGEVFFSENDESLASLLSSQAAAAIESAWLSHELRSNLANATQLYQLSFKVIQAQELSEAARYIAETAQKAYGAHSTGIILFTADRAVEGEVHLDEKGAHTPPQHPMDLIERAVESGQSIFLSSEEETSTICFPLKTSVRTYGALWLILPDRNGARHATNLQTLANQAAVALERSILLAESRQQASELQAAYRELETTYDHTLEALMSALDARDRETEGHSLRVAHLARLLGEHLQLTASQLKALERGSLLHDIGKIGVSDTILHKPGPLDTEEWRIMRLHPDIGARIVEGIPFLQDTLAVIRYHQERWDGSGYPVGLMGRDIPYLARIFAVADAFDALTSDRPYRTRIEAEDAIQYLREQAGILFDPQIVQAMETIASQGRLNEVV